MCACVVRVVCHNGCPSPLTEIRCNINRGINTLHHTQTQSHTSKTHRTCFLSLSRSLRSSALFRFQFEKSTHEKRRKCRNDAANSISVSSDTEKRHRKRNDCQWLWVAVAARAYVCVCCVCVLYCVFTVTDIIVCLHLQLFRCALRIRPMTTKRSLQLYISAWFWAYRIRLYYSYWWKCTVHCCDNVRK